LLSVAKWYKPCHNACDEVLPLDIFIRGKNRVILQFGRSQFTSLPSKLILAIGGLGMLWLILAGLLIVQLDDEIGFPASHAMAAIASSPLSSEIPAAARVLDAPDENERVDDTIEEILGGAAPVRENARARPSDGVLTSYHGGERATEQSSSPRAVKLIADDQPSAGVAHTHLPRSLLNAHDEPLSVELLVLFDTIMPSLAADPGRLDPAIVRQASALASRMNSDGQTFTVRFHDPIIDLARLRAVNGHLFLVDLGVRPWLLETSAQHGRRGVSVH
jgi:hypothetical protein